MPNLSGHDRSSLLPNKVDHRLIPVPSTILHRFFVADELDEDLGSIFDATSGILLRSISTRAQFFTLFKSIKVKTSNIITSSVDEVRTCYNLQERIGYPKRNELESYYQVSYKLDQGFNPTPRL